LLLEFEAAALLDADCDFDFDSDEDTLEVSFLEDSATASSATAEAAEELEIDEVVESFVEATEGVPAEVARLLDTTAFISDEF
jgi:hypothetical protein